MARALRFLPVIVFLALAVAPAALFSMTGPWPSPITPEFRPLRPFPPNIAPNTFRRISDWFSDRIGLRWPLLYLGVQITDRVWQPRVRGSVVLGNDPWLFWSDDETHPTSVMADVRGALGLSDERAAAVDSALRAVRTSYAACHKSALVVVAPNKQSIYPEELGLGGAGSLPSRFDGLLARLSREARPLVIDPRPDMRAAKGRYPAPLYFRGDTHWNEFGAYQAYRAVVEALARDNAIYRPELSAFDQFDVAIDEVETGDILMRVLYRTAPYPDQMPQFRAKAAPALPPLVKESNYLRAMNPGGRGRLVMHGDSFAPPLAKFLARHFAETILLPVTDWPLAFDGAIDARLQADVVLLEITERHLPDLAKASLNLEKACSN